MPKLSEETVIYMASLFALVAVVIGSMLIGAFFPNLLGKVEVFGLGTVTGGLIGLMRSPRARHDPAMTETYLGKIPNEEGALADRTNPVTATSVGPNVFVATTTGNSPAIKP